MKKRVWLLLLLAAVLAFTLVLAVACEEEPEPEPQPGGEKGQYVCLADGDEYLLSLDGFGEYKLFIKSEDLSGQYALEGSALTLKHSDEVSISGSYSNDTVQLNYNGGVLIFIRKVYYTVSFDTRGGSQISPVTVVNGKMLAQPADPARQGYRFGGWYLDEALKKPYVFGVSAVTGSFTLYAKWLEIIPGMSEYLVSFDLGYDGKVLDDVWTVEGKLQTVPEPSREGYVFAGWWISQFEDGDKLSYRFDENKYFTASATLFAVWNPANPQKLLAPLATVEGDVVKWDSVSGASSYGIEISRNGQVLANTALGGTTYNGFKFSENDPGLYEIKVLAVASDTSKNSDVFTLYYNNKALDRVSLFSVNNGVLVYNPVPDAQRYYITVYCGDENHRHENVSNGKFLSYDISNCELTDEGIKIVVRADANGYAASEGVYIYNPGKLAPVELSLNADGSLLNWLAVADAAEYVVYVNNERYNVGSDTSFSLKSLPAGKYQITVQPQTKGLISPAATKIEYEKTVPVTPADVKLVSSKYVEVVENANVTKLAYTLSWSEVDGATYEMDLCGQVFSLNSNEVDLGAPEYENIIKADVTDYTVKLRAKVGDKYSYWSDEIDIRYFLMAQSLSYSHGIVSWSPVIGASHYVVKVSGKYYNVFGGVTQFVPEYRASGEIDIEVAFVDVNTNVDSEYVGMKVYTYAVYLNANGGLVNGEEVPAVIYKSTGDAMNMPAPEKYGYNFDGWYNTPQGANTNGAKYKDDYFLGASELVLFAYYTPKTFEVELVTSEEGVSAPEKKVTVAYKQPFSFPVASNEDGTMAFEGWFRLPNGVDKLTDEYGHSLTNKVWIWTEDDIPDGETTLKVYPSFKSKVLEFVQTTHNGVEGYSVIKGTGIDDFSEITIPVSHKGLPVLMVGGGAFRYCYNLEVLNIPDTVKIIQDNNTFIYAYGLKVINVYHVDGNTTARYWSQDGVLYDRGNIDDIADVQNPQSTLMVFPRAKVATNFVMPEGKNIVKIEAEAFYYAKVKNLTIASSVAQIRKNAFRYSDIESVTFAPTPIGVAATKLTIDEGAFYYCDKLETIRLPARLEAINLNKYNIENNSITTYDTGDSFASCYKLREITVEDGCMYDSVDGMLVKDRELVYIPRAKTLGENGVLDIPVQITKIGKGAFIGMSGIQTVNIHSYITAIGEAAFYNVYVKEINFEGIAFAGLEIGDYAFAGNSSLTTLNFKTDSQVTKIGKNAFANCRSLESLTIPASVTSIEANAFMGCQGLVSVNIVASENDLAFGADVFKNCVGLKSFYVPKNVTEFPPIFAGCSALESVSVDENNPKFTAEDNVLYDKAKTEIIFYPIAKKGNPTLPETLVKIGAGVFMGNANIAEITIGVNVTEIGNEAFKDCVNLKKVLFTDGGTEELKFGNNVFSGCSKLTSFEFPARVKSFGDGFFEGTAITAITLPQGLTEIGAKAFYGLKALESITIPSTVTKIGYLAFSGGYSSDVNLKSIIFAENSQLEVIEEGAFRYFKGTSLVLPASLRELKYSAFYQATLLETIDFEANSQLTKIGPSAFYGCTALLTVKIPKSVTEIGSRAFYNCSKLVNVNFEDGGTADLIIGSYCEYYTISYSYSTYSYTLSTTSSYDAGYAFGSCSALSEIALPARTVEIMYYSFGNCSKLESITFGGDASRLTNIGERAFNYCSSLVSITIPKTVKSLPETLINSSSKSDRPGIGAGAFYYCSALETIEFAEGGTDPIAMGNGTFDSCKSLTALNLPARFSNYVKSDNTVVGAFGSAALTSYSSIFYGCSALMEINLASAIDPENSDATGYRSIDGILYSKDGTKVVYCPRARVKDVVIDSKATVIASEAFLDCKFIQSIDLANIQTLESNALKNCSSLTSLELPDTLKSFSISMIAGCTGLRSISVSDSSTSMKTIDGVIFSKDGKTLMYAPGSFGGVNGVYNVPAGVEIIAEQAFYNNKVITKVILPEGFKEIKKEAFSGATRLTSVQFPASLNKIGEKAFYNCTVLSEVKFPETMNGEYTIETNAFYYTSALQQITLSEGLSSIGTYAFQSSGVETISLPSTLTSIGESAFSGTSKLTTINFAALKGNLTIGKNAFYNSGIANLTLPEKVTSIGESAFQGSKLVAISLPSTLTTLGNKAFYGSKSLKEVVFHKDSVFTTIGTAVFYDCSALEKINIPASVTTIAPTGSYIYQSDATFGNCTALTQLIFDEGSQLTTIGKYAFFNCSALEQLDLTAATKLTTLDNYSFKQTSKLASISLPDSVTTLGEYVFYSSGLVSFTVPTGVTRLANYTFYYCEQLEEVTLHNKITAIGTSSYPRVFSNCYALKSLVIPDSVTTLLSGLFNYNTSLTSLTLPQGITSIPSGFFDGLSALTSIVIPDSVTSLNANFSYCYALQSVKLPQGLTSLPSNMFSGCKYLTDVELPANLTAYPDAMFKGCELITSIVIPSTVTSLGTECFGGTGITSITIPTQITSLPNKLFANCKQLQQINLHNGITAVGGGSSYSGYSPFYNCIALESIDLPQAATLSPYLFEGCANLTSVTLPINLQEIPNYMFKNCTSLRAIAIPSSVISLGSYMFTGCINLRTVDLPANITAIPMYCFENCTSLSAITLPATVSELGNYAFKGCKSISSVDISNIDTFGKGCFAGTGIVTFTIPSSMTTIPDSFFEDCEKLTSVTMHDFIEAIGTAAKGSNVFKNCIALETFEFPESVTSIGGSLFEGCVNLKSIKLPPELAAIPQNLFNGLTSLTSIELPEGISSIGAYAFQDSAIENVIIPESVTTIETYAFANTPLKTIELKEGLEAIADYAFTGCASLTEIAFPSTLLTIGLRAFEGAGLLEVVIPGSVTSVGNYAFSKTPAVRFETLAGEGMTIGNYLFGFSGSGDTDKNETLQTVILGEGVTSIGDYAFQHCLNLSELSLPSTLVTINRNAFGYTAITEVVLPEGVKELYPDAFWYCNSLKKVSIPSTITKMETSAFSYCDSLVEVKFAETIDLARNSSGEIEIGSVFSDCKSLTTVNLPEGITSLSGTFDKCSSLAAITLPSTLKRLGYTVFRATALVNVELPEGLTEIAYRVFDSCDKLETVKLPASLQTINYSVFENCTSLKNVIFAENSVLSTIKYDVFLGCSALESITLPDSVDTIERSIFKNCTALTNVGLPNGGKYTVIANNMFEGCTSLQSIVIPDSVKEIQTEAFLNSGIKTFTAPAKWNKAGTAVFKGSALEEFTVPDFMTEIPREFFRDCKNLTVVHFHSRVSILGDNCFNGCSAITAFELPASLITVNAGALTNMSGLQGFTIEGDSDTFKIYEGALYDAGGALLAYPCGKAFSGLADFATGINGNALYGCEIESLTIPLGITLNSYSLAGATIGTLTFADAITILPANLLNGSTLGSVNLPAGLKEIPSSLFDGVKGLQSIVIPNGVTKIGSNAFRNSEIKSVTIPNTVTIIDTAAFRGCEQLATVTFEKGGNKALRIGSSAFYGCTALKSIEIPFRARTTDYENRGVGQYAFCKSGLVTVTFEQSNDSFDGSNNVLSFGGEAFKECVDLVSISFPEWVKPIKVNGSIHQPFIEEYEEYDYWEGGYYYIEYCSTFEGCTSLQTVVFNMQSDLEFNIGKYMFHNCSSLTTLVLPANTYSLGYEALRGCTGMSEITLTASMYVGSFVFEDWTAEQTIIIVGTQDDIKGWSYSWSNNCEAQIVFVDPEEAAD